MYVPPSLSLSHTHTHTRYKIKIKGGGGGEHFIYIRDFFFIKRKYTNELDNLYCGFNLFYNKQKNKKKYKKIRLLLGGFHGWLDLTVVLVTVTDAVRTIVVLPVGAKNIFIGHPFNVQPDVYIGEQDAHVREDVGCGYKYVPCLGGGGGCGGAQYGMNSW